MKTFLFRFLLLSSLLTGCTKSDATGSSPREEAPETPRMAKVGFTAPDFELKNFQGQIVSLRSVRGKIVLINFWATWCTPCRAEMPSIEQLYRSFRREDFEILAVSSDEDGLRSVKPFMNEFRFTFPILLDETLRIDEMYGVRNIPTSFILDRNGLITNRFFGAMDWNEPAQKKFIFQLINSPA